MEVEAAEGGTGGGWEGRGQILSAVIRTLDVERLGQDEIF